MPSLEHHCDISIKRTDKDYRDLHKWVDENSTERGVNHRTERHSYTTELKDIVSRRFGGAEAVSEWLFHIALDNLDTSVLNDYKYKHFGNRRNFFKFGFAPHDWIYYDEDDLDEGQMIEEFDE
jgi:hypothetical protein